MSGALVRGTDSVPLVVVWSLLCFSSERWPLTVVQHLAVDVDCAANYGCNGWKCAQIIDLGVSHLSVDSESTVSLCLCSQLLVYRCSSLESQPSTLLAMASLAVLLSDLDNCKWSGPDFWRFAIKKFAIIKQFFYSIIILLEILVKFSCQSSSDVFYFIKTYLINKNIIKFNFNLTLPY